MSTKDVNQYKLSVKIDPKELLKAMVKPINVKIDGDRVKDTIHVIDIVHTIIDNVIEALKDVKEEKAKSLWFAKALGFAPTAEDAKERFLDAINQKFKEGELPPEAKQALEELINLIPIPKN